MLSESHWNYDVFVQYVNCTCVPVLLVRWTKVYFWKLLTSQKCNTDLNFCGYSIWWLKDVFLWAKSRELRTSGQNSFICWRGNLGKRRTVQKESVAVIWPPRHKYRTQPGINATEMQLKREKGPNIEWIKTPGQKTLDRTRIANKQNKCRLGRAGTPQTTPF